MAFFESRTRPCLLYQIRRCSGPCTGEIDFPGYTELVREATDFLSGRSRAGEAGAGRRNGKGLGRTRIRNGSTLPRPPRGAVGDPVAAGHQSAHRGGSRRVRHPSGGRLFLRRGVLLPHRTELGQPRLFSARGEIVHAGRGAGLVPRAVLRRQAAAETGAAVARHRGKRAVGRRALDQGRVQGGSRHAAARREEGTDRARADQCARGARPQAGRYRDPEPAAAGAWPQRSGCRIRRSGSRSTTTATSRAPTRSAP